VPSAGGSSGSPSAFPIADAHYAMGLHSSRKPSPPTRTTKSRPLPRILEQTRGGGGDAHGWGYPFNWQTRNGCITEGTPLITTVPMSTRRFPGLPDRQEPSVAADHGRHGPARTDAIPGYRDGRRTPPPVRIRRPPTTLEAVVNASAYRAFVLSKAAVDLSDSRYLRGGEEKSEFRPCLAGCGWLVALFDRRSRRVRRPFPHVLRPQGAREDREAHRIAPRTEPSNGGSAIT